MMRILKTIVCISTIWVVLTLSAYGQCQNDSVCVPQATINQAAQAVDELKAARDVIARFQVERSASEAERGAATALIKGLNDLLATKDKIISEYERINELYKKVIDFQQVIIERLEGQLNKPKSGWQKFLTTLKEIALVLSGVILGRGL
jgi:hypothetical protein